MIHVMTRKEKMQELKDGGMSMAKIAKQFGISRERVRQILSDKVNITLKIGKDIVWQSTLRK